MPEVDPKDDKPKDKEPKESKDTTEEGKGEDEEDGGEGEGGEGETGPAGTGKKKRRRRRKKKKGGGGGGGEGDGVSAGAGGGGGGAKGTPSKKQEIRLLGGFTDAYVKYGQTEPPSIPVCELFPGKDFPAGEEQDHPGDHNTYRVTSAEERAKDRAASDLYETLREAAEVHRQVRMHAQSYIRPGIKLIDMCERLEEMNRSLVKEDGLNVSRPLIVCL